jgi:DNA-binding MarR family transcriptional regulator
MLTGSIHDVAVSIFDFEPQFNDKIATILVPVKNGKRALTKSQFKALIRLHLDPGRTATELGEAMDMTKASLTGILDILEARLLAKRKADPADRRRVRLYLTEAGRKLCEAEIREFDKALEVRMSPLPESDRVALARHLAGAASILKKLED